MRHRPLLQGVVFVAAKSSEALHQSAPRFTAFVESHHTEVDLWCTHWILR